MASVNNYNFPHFPPPPTPFVSPPTPARPIRPSPPPPVIPPTPASPIRSPPPPVIPPPAPKPTSPPPPHVTPPPPPHRTPPPKPHPITPPPPHILPPPPPSPPDHHSTVIIIVFVSFGCLLFLACSLLALWCFLKKRKKKAVEETKIVNMDEHLKVQEAIVQGPHGQKTVVLSVEDDVHVNEVDYKKSKSLSDEQSMHAKSGEIAPSSLEEGRSSSSPGHHHSKQNPS
ncbi:protein TRACHEARY ELEMENT DIFFERENTIATION-RELATED 7A [Coffea arabica]|uniref:Protein TRACHEARY ELEMENT DIFFERENTIATION-RELATED 7A n=1 Tax=Coffea arabica TaxID=13443 RepID=A0A6P6UUS5_COFAR|nr:proline-rich receptor-like protein kinase PERK10 [Coffea arabica]